MTWVNERHGSADERRQRAEDEWRTPDEGERGTSAADESRMSATFERLDERLDERLEAELRSLPELDAPLTLLRRVMEEVHASDVDAVRDADSCVSPNANPSADPSAGPNAGPNAVPSADPNAHRRRMHRVPWWQPAFVAVAFASLASIVLVRHAAPVVVLLGDVVRVAADGIHTVTDAAIGAVSGLWALFAKAAVASSVLANVARTVAEVVLTEAGSVIVGAVGVAVALQLVLLSVVRRRPEVR